MDVVTFIWQKMKLRSAGNIITHLDLDVADIWQIGPVLKTWLETEYNAVVVQDTKSHLTDDVVTMPQDKYTEFCLKWM